MKLGNKDIIPVLPLRTLHQLTKAVLKKRINLHVKVKVIQC